MPALTTRIRTAAAVAVIAVAANFGIASASATTDGPIVASVHPARNVTARVASVKKRAVEAKSAAEVPISGSWTSVFDDEFDGSSLNTSVWDTHNGWTDQNNVTTEASNVTVSGGDAILDLASSKSGAEIGTSKFGLKVGEYAEARIQFAGSGSSIYDWPAWWASGPSWPKAGENDVAEGLGTLTVNYHSPSGTHNQGTVPGTWANSFHTYGIERLAHQSKVFWDGTLVESYPTDDDDQPEELLLNIGASNKLVFGASGRMLVDYVRVWAPA
jgi:Glycosyl hydrolases family 16